MAASACATATSSACSRCCKAATGWKFTVNTTGKPFGSSDQHPLRGTERWPRRARTHKQAEPHRTVWSNRKRMTISGGHYANGNHLHGGSCRDGLLTGGSPVGGGTHFRTDLPVVFCTSGDTRETRTQTMTVGTGVRSTLSGVQSVQGRDSM